MKRIDLRGQTFGEWKVLRYVGKKLWECECSCGKIGRVTSEALRLGKSKSCGHDPYNRIDLTGKQFGKWTVIRYAGLKRWLCKCSCGIEKEVFGLSLRNGTSNSCGHNPKLDTETNK